jgi:hypothetical protein
LTLPFEIAADHPPSPPRSPHPAVETATIGRTPGNRKYAFSTAFRPNPFCTFLSEKKGFCVLIEIVFVILTQRKRIKRRPMSLKKRIKAVIAGLLATGSLMLFAFPAQAFPPAVALAVHAVQPPEDTLKVKVNVIDNRIIVTDAPAKSRLQIYNIVGVRVREIEIKHPSEEYAVSLPKGYYIVRIQDTVRKIVIR